MTSSNAAADFSTSGLLAAPTVLATERLLVRPLTEDDLEDCHRLHKDIGWTVRGLTGEEARERRRT